MVHMNQNMGDKLAFPPKLPKLGKTQYDALCEVLNEYNMNLMPLSQMAIIEIMKRLDIYEAYSKSASGSYFHFFDSIDLGSDYTAHLGMMCPVSDFSEDCIEVAITKDFVMADGCSYTLVIVNINDDLEPVFFTEYFWEVFTNTTMLHKDVFFLDLAIHYKSIYSRWETGEVRWLLYEGMALGRRYCQFDVFHDFTNSIKYTNGVDEDDLEDQMWNEV